MDKFAKNFIKASLVYFIIGSFLGGLMVIHPQWVGIFSSAHAHLNLLGWISMMIFGVGYHILPRFSGQPLYSPKLANIQYWLANLGLIGMAIFFIIRGALLYSGAAPASVNIALIFLALFGGITFISTLLFAWNLFKTIK
ncbi:MAG: cbb3-type cytochrome c oxidase subunit I [bacterium]|nr:cbb3-type cytochrome c oxidase subunit I [bacterium]